MVETAWLVSRDTVSFSCTRKPSLKLEDCCAILYAVQWKRRAVATGDYLLVTEDRCMCQLRNKLGWGLAESAGVSQSPDSSLSSIKELLP